MATFKKEDVKGIRNGRQGMFCKNCVSAIEKETWEETNIITKDDVEKSGKYLFCDKCHKIIL